MPYYYVTHPNLDMSATVHAPSTEKARTTFLDYLERQGSILRGQRNLLRENMVASRIDHPQDVLSDVELHYEMAHREAPYEDLGRVQLSQPTEEEEQLVEQPIVQPQVQAEGLVAQGMSPIARVSLGVR